MGRAEGGVCLVMFRFVVGMLLTEHRFERRYSESGIIVQVPSKYQPGALFERLSIDIRLQMRQVWHRNDSPIFHSQQCCRSGAHAGASQV